ncbi:Ser/Thr phosphatase family superfamily protein [Balamuthia mandrillaris]
MNFRRRKEEKRSRPVAEGRDVAPNRQVLRRPFGLCRRACVAGLCVGLVLVLYLLSWPLVMLYVVHPPNLTETVQMRSFNVSIAGLHPSLHGLKVAQLTDIHFNDNNSVHLGATDDILRQALDIVEQQEVDLVFLTGDYVDHWPETASTLGRKWLSRLKSKHGVVAILGNHDYQKPQSKRLVMEAFATANITTLINAKAEPINEWLEVMGIGDLWEDYHPHRVMYPLPAPREVGEGSFRKARIVLTHNPDSAIDLSRWGADLMLAGHTHGGRECLAPGLRELWPLVNHLPEGVRRRIPGSRALKNWELSYGWIDVPRPLPKGQATLPPHEPGVVPLYVSSGLDRLPPRFLLCHAEVAVFTLVPALSSGVHIPE